MCPSTAPMIRVLTTLFPLDVPGRALDHPCTSRQPSVLTSHDRPGVTVLLRRPQVLGRRAGSPPGAGAVRDSASCSAPSTWLPGYQIHLAGRNPLRPRRRNAPGLVKRSAEVISSREKTRLEDLKEKVEPAG